jgi:hypothetical protein
VTSHPVSKLQKGRGRSRDPTPASEDDHDAGIGGSTALGTARSLIRWPESPSDSPQHWSKIWDFLTPSYIPGQQDTRTVEKGRETPKTELLPPANNLGGSATEKAPASLVTTHITTLKRKSSLPWRTANSPLRSKTPSLQPVTKVDMTTVNQSAELQPVTSVPPFGQLRSGSSFLLQVTLVTQTIPVRMAASRAPTLSHRSARSGGLPLRRIARSSLA